MSSDYLISNATKTVAGRLIVGWLDYNIGYPREVTDQYTGTIVLRTTQKGSTKANTRKRIDGAGAVATWKGSKTTAVIG